MKRGKFQNYKIKSTFLCIFIVKRRVILISFHLRHKYGLLRSFKFVLSSPSHNCHAFFLNFLGIIPLKRMYSTPN